MTNPTNAKGRPFSWSFSALDDYEGCPRRYAERRFYCNLPYEETQATIWGNRVHKAAELVLKDQPHNDPEAFAPVAKYVEAFQRSGRPVAAELEVCLTEGLWPTEWFAKDAWLRVKIDVVVDKPEGDVGIFDWKTGGKVYPKEDQFRLCAIALSVVKNLRHVDGGFIWTAHQAITPCQRVTGLETPKLWEDFLARAARMKNAWADESFPARSNPLCGWCQVASCKYKR